MLRPVVGARSVLILDAPEHMPAAQDPAAAVPRRAAEGARGDDARGRPSARSRAGRAAAMRLHPHMQALTLEIILRTIFGVRGPPALRAALRQLLDDIGGPIGDCADGRCSARARCARTALFRSEMDPVDELLYETIRARRAEASLAERDDVLSLLLRHARGRHDARRELRDELVTLLVAGHETTATALAWAVERLVRHPQALGACALRSPATRRTLDAVVKETLRLRPVLPIVVRKLRATIEVGGHAAAAGVASRRASGSCTGARTSTRTRTRSGPSAGSGKRPGTYDVVPVRRRRAALHRRGVRRDGDADRAPGDRAGRRLEPVRAEPERVTRRSITFTPSRGGEVLAIPRNRSAASAVREAEELTV